MPHFWTVARRDFQPPFTTPTETPSPDFDIDGSEGINSNDLLKWLNKVKEGEPPRIFLVDFAHHWHEVKDGGTDSANRNGDFPRENDFK